MVRSLIRKVLMFHAPLDSDEKFLENLVIVWVRVAITGWVMFLALGVMGIIVVAISVIKHLLGV